MIGGSYRGNRETLEQGAGQAILTITGGCSLAKRCGLKKWLILWEIREKITSTRPDMPKSYG